MWSAVGFLALIGDLVIDRAAINDFPGLRIDDDDFGGAGHAQLLADQLIGVHEDRQVVAVGLRLATIASRLSEGVEFSMKISTPLGEYSSCRALTAALVLRLTGQLFCLRDQHHRAGVAELAQFMRMQILIGQSEVIDRGRQRNFGRGFRRRA